MTGLPLALASVITGLAFIGPGIESGLTVPRGIILARVSLDTGVVRYLPADPIWVDALGKAVPKPEIQSLGQAGWLVSGWVSFVAPPEALVALREETARKLGKPSRLVEISPGSFGVRLALGSDVIWERPIAGGNLKTIPVQVTIPSRPTLPDNVTLILSLTWEEKLPAIQGNITIKWENVERRLRAALRNGSLSEKDLSTVTQ